MRTKARLALEVGVNGKRRTLAVLRGKGVVQAWIAAERLDVPDRVTLQLTALDTTNPGTDTFSRWRKVKLPVGSSVEIRALTTNTRGDPPANVVRHKLPPRRKGKRQRLRRARLAIVR